MNQENFYDPEKPEEYVYDPELVDYNQFFKDLWEKEDTFLKSVGGSRSEVPSTGDPSAASASAYICACQ